MMKPSAPSTPSDTSSSARSTDRQRPAPKPEREAFEQLLEAREGREPRPEAAGLVVPPTPFEFARSAPSKEDTPGLERTDLHRAAPLQAAAIEPPPSVVGALPDPSQAAWARRLEAPATAPGAATRFQVIDPAAPRWLSSVEVQPLAGGGVNVAVVAGAEHAALLDRHVPQLQRRLGARAQPHVRVDPRDDDDR